MGNTNVAAPRVTHKGGGCRRRRRQWADYILDCVPSGSLVVQSNSKVSGETCREMAEVWRRLTIVDSGIKIRRIGDRTRSYSRFTDISVFNCIVLGED